MKKYLKNCPRYISSRYSRLYSYMWESLFNDEYRRKIIIKINKKDTRQEVFNQMKDITAEATLLTQIFITKKLFTDGAQAAKIAVDTFKELDISSFNIGKTCFKKRNENVIRGDVLARELIKSFQNTQISNLLKEINYISDIIKKYEKIKEKTFN